MHYILIQYNHFVQSIPLSKRLSKNISYIGLEQNEKIVGIRWSSIAPSNSEKTPIFSILLYHTIFIGLSF